MICLLIILFIVSINAKLEPKIKGPNCLIHNRLYPNEYLYTSNEIWRQFLKRNVYTYPLNEVDQLIRITWSIIPIHINNDTILIKSNKFNEYLCAFDKNPDAINGIKPTLVKLNLALIQFYEKCVWKLRKQVNFNQNNHKNSSLSSYSIWNFKFNQPIYAASFLYKKNLQKRNIFLWPKPIKSMKNLTDEFFWIIDYTKSKLE